MPTSQRRQDRECSVRKDVAKPYIERPTRKGVGLFRYMLARMGNVTLQGGEYLKLIEARQGGAAAG